ncbi:MAG TPA: SDR family oxidoreductase [Gemmatimonadaceae bacterium]
MTSSSVPNTALVTGGSRGIGLAIARALVREGVRVALVARGARELDARAKELGHETLAIAADLSISSDVDRAVHQLSNAFGGAPDLLINNAGIFDPKPLHVLGGDEFERMMKINLIAPFLVLRALLPKWRDERRGHVITIGSIADRTIFPGNAAYSASKFGARAMHEVLRVETKGTGVRTTLVSPSSTDTPIWDPVLQQGDSRFPPRSAMLGADAVADAVVWAATRPTSVNIDELRMSAS